MNRRSFIKTSLTGAAAGLAAAKTIFAQKAIKPATTELKTAGIKMISIDGGKFRVWTKKIGSGKIKLLLLHGGPGATHEYFECFEDFLPGAGIEFYYYDQLGSNYSDQPTDASLWTISRFVEEVEQVRQALNLENFYLLGHSWGGMLGIEYALKYQKHLKGFVLSNMTASIPAYVKYANQLKSHLPPESIAILDKYEAAKDYENPEYQKVMFGEIYAKHLCRLPEFPEPLQRAFRHLNAQVYNTMQGPNEFVVTGNFKDWDRWADLPKIKAPTLVLGAANDEMNPADIRRKSELIPNARLAMCANGSHMAMWDDQAAYFRHLINFIRDNERGVKMK